MSETLGGFYTLFMLFVVVLAILWFLLPFAVFGIKDKLNDIIDETKNTNTELEKLRADIASLAQIKSND